MFFRSKKSLHAIAFFLVFCLASGSALAAMPDGNAPPGADQPNELSAGILTAPDAPSVRVNGNAAQDGMTILSGSEIKTSSSSGATINLRRLGKAELGADTTVKLVFTDEQVTLQVFGGQAQLTTFKGVSGLLINADGKELKTDPSLDASSIGNIAAVAAASTAATVPVVSGGLFGLGALGTMGVVGGVVGGSVLAWAAAATGDASESPVSSVQP